MIDCGTLAMSFATAVATEAGSRLIDWLKRHFESNATEVAEAIVANPDNDGAKRILADLLQKELEKRPRLTEELGLLLDQVGVDYAPQTSTVSGGGTNIQIQGDNNRIGG